MTITEYIHEVFSGDGSPVYFNADFGREIVVATFIFFIGWASSLRRSRGQLKLRLIDELVMAQRELFKHTGVALAHGFFSLALKLIGKAINSYRVAIWCKKGIYISCIVCIQLLLCQFCRRGRDECVWLDKHALMNYQFGILKMFET